MTDARDQWHLVYFIDPDDAWRGQLIQDAQYGAVIDVSHLYEDWAAEEHPRPADDRQYGTAEEVRQAAIRQWRQIDYLSRGAGAVLRIDGKVAAEVAGES